MPSPPVSRLEDAVTATREFLTPVTADRWLPLALVAFFLAGTAGPGSLQPVFGQVSVEAPFGDGPAGGAVPEVPPEVLVLGALVAVSLLVLGLLFMLAGSVMEFVLVEILRTETVAVRAPARRYLRAGLSLFGFRLALAVLTLVPLAVLGVFLFAPVVADPTLGGALGAVAVFLAVAVPVGLVSALVHGLTVEFVVPVMVAESCGLLAGWRRLWPTVRENRRGVAVYVVLRWIVGLAVSMVAGFVTGIVAALVAIPFVFLGGTVWLGTGAALSPGTVLALVPVFALFLVVVAAFGAVVQVPLKTYTRYYELLVLGDLEPAFDLVAERRADLDADAPGEGGARPA